MVKVLERKTKMDVVKNFNLGKDCKECNITFSTEAELKDHILTTVHGGPSDGTRNFSYRLTAKTAKKNIVRGAQRKHIDVVYKQGAINVDFSDGAWVFAAFPEVLNWASSYQNFTFGLINIKVIEANAGMDDGSKNVDHKIVFQVNGQKVVLHAYNTKQRFTVTGQGYKVFVEKYLDPVLRKKIENSLSEANNFNKKVLQNLGKTVRRDNVKFKTNSSFKCKNCSNIAKSISQLHEHMQSMHERSMSMSMITDTAMFNSTKNTSSTERLMIEDMSINGIDEPSLDEAPETSVKTDAKVKEYHCDVWYSDNSPCRFKSSIAGDVLKHTEEIHAVKKAEADDNVTGLNEGQKEYEILTEKSADIPASLREKVDYKDDEIVIAEEEVKEENNIVNETKKNFCCDRCNNTFESQAHLEDHLSNVHKTEEIDYQCKKCEYKSKTETGMRRHEQLFCVLCQICLEGNVEFNIHNRFHDKCQAMKCNYTAKSSHDLKSHVITSHGRLTCTLCRQECEDEESLDIHEKTHLGTTNSDEKVIHDYKCNNCEYRGLAEHDLRSHMQTVHMNIKVDISDHLARKCPNCDYRCQLNIQMKKHIERKHENIQSQSLQYNCSVCDFESDYLASMWKHLMDDHTGENIQLNSKLKQDILINLVAEQNVDLMGDISSLKTTMMEAFFHLADAMEKSFKNIKYEVKQEVVDGNTEIKTLINNMEKELKQHITETKREKEPENIPQMEDNDNHEIFENNHIPKKKKKSLKHKVTWIGTSLSKVLDRKKVENDLNVELTVKKAYCIKEEGRYKKSNFSSIVPEVVKAGDVDTLVLQAGSIELTNIDVNSAMMMSPRT